MTYDFRETKIKILSEEHSRAFQMAVIAAGGGWNSEEGVMYLSAKFLFVDADLNLGFENNDSGYFDSHKNTEIHFPLPIKGISTNHKNDTQMKRKVRKDFDPTKEYRVNVKGCTKEEKKTIQQAFFDAGFQWVSSGDVYRHLDAAVYTNTMYDGQVTAYCMCGSIVARCNMTAEEFLEHVYGPEQQGHVHAELMAQYAEDAQTHAEPWELWQAKAKGGVWMDCLRSPRWVVTKEYRRKPKTHIVHGVEIPDLRVTPELGGKYYLADPTSSELVELHTFVMRREMLWFERGLSYQHSEEGKQAAVLHSKAMLGIV